MKNTKQRLREIKENGYELNFNDVFNESFENYKKIAMSGGLTFLILGVCLILLCLFLYIFAFGFASISKGISGLNLSNFQGTGIVIYFISVVIITALLTPIYAGVIKMAYNADQNKTVSVGTSFEYYRNGYFMDLFLSSVIIASASTGFNYLFEFLNMGFVGIILSYTIAFFTFLTPLFIIFGNLKAIEAIEASLITITKQLPVLLGLIIIGILMVCLGFFAFCIGIFFTIPFIYSLYFVIYKKIFEIDEHSEIDEIGLFEN
jgi:hypothetical protein